MEGSFETLYREQARQVYRYLLSLGCPPEDAEDITQDTFVKALLAIDQFRGESKVSVWLCQIARNTWFTHVKKKQKQISQSFPAAVFQDDHICDWMDLLEELEEPYRSVFLKKALGDWSYQELARYYQKSESWARVTYHRARMKLKGKMDERSL